MSYDEGDAVSITGGDFSGSHGTVVGWHNHRGNASEIVPKITYAVKLSKPVEKIVSQEFEIPPGSGNVTVKKEKVIFDRVEVHPDHLAVA